MGEILYDEMVYGRSSQPSELLIYFSTVSLRHKGLEIHLQPSTKEKGPIDLMGSHHYGNVENTSQRQLH